MKYLILLFVLLSLAVPYKVKATSSSIFISEILPDGEGTDSGKEWIELYNNSTVSINLKDYYFINKSSSGSERKIVITSSISIPSKQYFIISEGAQSILSENILVLGAGKINMYNDESDLELHDIDGAIVDSIHYSKPTENKSFERKGPENILDCNKLVLNPQGNSIMLDNLAKNAVCFGLPETTPPTTPPVDSCLSIGLITSNLVDSSICTRGYLTVEPETLGEKIFYIEDGGLGLKVKMKDPLSLILESSYRVEISGTLKSIKDGLYLYGDSVKIVGDNKEILPANVINLKSQKYSLVEYSGEIMKNYSKSIDLEFGDSTLRVSVLASTGINMPERVVGDKLKVKGILVEEGSIFKILPRYQEDIEILDQEIIASKSTSQNVAEIPEKKVVKVSRVSNQIYSKAPILNINTNVKAEKNMKYSINRGWILLLLLATFLVLIIILFRKKIISKLKSLNLIEFKTISTEIVSTKNLDFEKDKYELMFGDRN
ncbi:MAG: lamin tail domain-containing protein [Candidatus Dojkabacteria bacterium]